MDKNYYFYGKELVILLYICNLLNNIITMIYTIKPGDTLSSIAKRFGTTVQNILKKNPKITNPNLIYAYDKIVI